MDLKLSREEKIFYNGCIYKNQREINTLSDEAEIARLTAEINHFEEEIRILENNITYLEELLKPLLNNAISSIASFNILIFIFYLIKFLYHLWLSLYNKHSNDLK